MMKVVEKGWGHELWIVNKSEYCGKRMFFEKGILLRKENV